MARRGKKKSLARRIRRLLFLASATVAIVRFAMARRQKTAPSEPRAPEWAPLRAADPTPRASEAADPTPRASEAADATPSATNPAAATPRASEATVADWVDPVDGSCPATHPVKGKASSKIYHLPGGRFYDTTVPERCYRDPQAAEADGMRASKR